MNIYSEVSSIRGVGLKLEEKLNKTGIFTVLDLLLYFPKDYEFVTGNSTFDEIVDDEKQILTCKAICFEKDFRTKTGKRLTTLNFEYMGHKVIAKWFNQPYIKNNFRAGENYNLMGKFKKEKNTLEIINPIIACNDAIKNEIVPKYSLKNDLTNKIISKLIHQVLDKIKITENFPYYLIEKYNLVSLDDAIRNIHFPSYKEGLERAIARLKFQELFTYSMKLLLVKKHIKEVKSGIEFKMAEELKDLKNSLPFQLTTAQTRVIREILMDQKRPYPMNRLVQGDVGSGKTIIALIAMFNVYMNGYQVALMVPTEILASQHYKEALKIFKGFNINIEQLTGNTSLAEKRRIKEIIKNGTPVVVIGTHALIQDDVEFANLGLVVTDEQHRFGVEQRSKLINKSKEADVLVMTATPIPRTLALYLYSDLDVSVIDELPPGRKRIETVFFQNNLRAKAYSIAVKEIEKGRQIYIVCPLIQEDEKGNLNSVEKLFYELKETYFSDIEIAMLHGKMSGKEKEEIINRFKCGEVKAIISTTVIEVGVNVPNASVMIIENAERFGLAQLHQLRGRVGRGEYQSYCILIANAKNNITKKRMMIMTESTDGFYISEQDLKLRGTGEMFGVKQHGDSGLLLADIIEDMMILKCASQEANRVIDSKDCINIALVEEISKNLERNSKYICFN
ncbi:ATP-dependent DNA helicase RecG [Clostridium polyendosporum]|uniref:ATP-dependent DNA helicase RecG n=1 Tax=Clostridium polyendosporum TaxID=69208 RepID=A0A919RX19_9CLOT|nr:ATP-dependent DNA helicase RecG [Clostridium polyendosporum]GIM27847.1 ATP-dependent DNA helicase RecG [Clostridium polyendosporum]